MASNQERGRDPFPENHRLPVSTRRNEDVEIPGKIGLVQIEPFPTQAAAHHA
jgi:hypothetical protein